MLWVFGLVLICLPVGSVSGGGKPTEGSVGPVRVVPVVQVLQAGADFGDGAEVLDVEALVSEAPVEGHHKGGFPR